jgi:hypothetical protein
MSYLYMRERAKEVTESELRGTIGVSPILSVSRTGVRTSRTGVIVRGTAATLPT